MIKAMCAPGKERLNNHISFGLRWATLSIKRGNVFGAHFYIAVCLADRQPNLWKRREQNMSNQINSQKNGRLIALANQKGGGKTTTVSLGSGLALQGKKCCWLTPIPRAISRPAWVGRIKTVYRWRLSLSWKRWSATSLFLWAGYPMLWRRHRPSSVQYRAVCDGNKPCKRHEPEFTMRTYVDEVKNGMMYDKRMSK